MAIALGIILVALKMNLDHLLSAMDVTDETSKQIISVTLNSYLALILFAIRELNSFVTTDKIWKNP